MEKLEESFVNSKEQKLEAVKDGIKTFDPSRKTALATDWSKDEPDLYYFRENANVPLIVSPAAQDAGW